MASTPAVVVVCEVGPLNGREFRVQVKTSRHFNRDLRRTTGPTAVLERSMRFRLGASLLCVMKRITHRARSATRRSPVRRTPTRSFACPEDLWSEVSAFAARHGVLRSDALRMLLTDGLHAASRRAELDEAREWQVAQAWAEARHIAAGDRSGVRWKVIEERFDQARERIRKRDGHQAATRG